MFSWKRADPSRPRRENINIPIGILRFREPSQRLLKSQSPWESQISVESVKFHGISWKSIEFHEMCKIHDFGEIPDFQWNAPQKHQVILWLNLCFGVAPGDARSARRPWRSTKCMPLQQKAPTTYWLSCFSWRFSPFRRRCEKPWHSYRNIGVSGVPFPAKSSFSSFS